MLNFKRYGVRMVHEDSAPGSYSQHFLDAEDKLDAKIRARLDFGPGWEVEGEVFGPFESLSCD